MRTPHKSGGRAVANVRAFAALFALGLAGVLSLWPMLDAAVEAVQAADPHAAPPEALVRPLLLLQPLVLTALGTVLGLAFAHRLALRSVIVHRARGSADVRLAKTDLVQAAIGGMIAGSIIVLGDAVFAHLEPAVFDRLRVPSGERLPALLSGVLYGGLSEEIIARWGLMSVIACVALKAGLSRSTALWIGTMTAALLFAAGHLPALMQALGGPQPVAIARTLLLNATAGAIFGALYWRHNLETAMLAHVLAHVVLFAGRLAGVAL